MVRKLSADILYLASDHNKCTRIGVMIAAYHTATNWHLI